MQLAHIHLHSQLLGLRSPHQTQKRGWLKVTWAQENVKNKLLLVLLWSVCLLRVLRSSKGKMGIFYLLIMLLIVELWWKTNVIWGAPFQCTWSCNARSSHFYHSRTAVLVYNLISFRFIILLRKAKGNSITENCQKQEGHCVEQWGADCTPSSTVRAFRRWLGPGHEKAPERPHSSLPVLEGLIKKMESDFFTGR